MMLYEKLVQINLDLLILAEKAKGYDAEHKVAYGKMFDAIRGHVDIIQDELMKAKEEKLKGVK